MTLIDFIVATQWLFLLFFVCINGGYLITIVFAFLKLPDYLRHQVLRYKLPRPWSDFFPPISILLLAYNEEEVIVSSIHSLLKLDYPAFEIVVVNDGSTDKTLEVLKEEFRLVLFPEAFRYRIWHKPVRAVYQSTIYPEIRVIDKENDGSKAAANNAGFNGARFSLVCPLDADSVLQPDSLKLLVQPFLENPNTVAVGGTVRIVNGCQVRDGVLTRKRLPTNILALFQTVEYLRAFLFARVGFAAMNALPLISGAFGLFHKESVIAVGGYKLDALGEDMELVMRLHCHFRLQGKPYRIAFVADAVCWTEVPESLSDLMRQRIRWQRGMLESVMGNRELMFHPKSGWLGWFSVPFMFFFEGIGAGLEALGFFFIIASYALDLMSLPAFAGFMMVAIGMGSLQSIASILLEEMTFNTYPKTRQLLWLLLAGIVENLGYRQLNSLWRMVGLYKWLFKYKSIWGEMMRSASWTGKARAAAASQLQNIALLSGQRAALSALQSKAAGTPFLRKKYNAMFKSGSGWGERAGIASRVGKTLDQVISAQVLQRRGGKVSRKLVTDPSKVQDGTKKTAVELSIRRLKGEVAKPEAQHK
jgi:cellulose synthase/poly-beta-1,6-N-acetylglucosamine synthase-like glycosyltransferase